MRKFIILCVLFFLNIPLVFAAQTKIQALHVQSTNKSTRLVFDVSSIPEHKIFQLTNPERLVIDFKDAYVEKSLAQPPKNHPLLTSLHAAYRNKKDLRVVLHLQSNVTHKSFVVKENKKHGSQVVIDLPIQSTKTLAKKPTVKTSKSVKAVAKSSNAKHLKTKNKKVLQSATKSTVKKTSVKARKVVKTNTYKAKRFVVAVDAGHGGKDPGARGTHGTLEKKVVFEIAQKLTALINSQAGMKAIMVRKGDYFVPLRERINIARKANADLFISIHADAFNDADVTGASVFTLSRRGATSVAARWLADSENASDLAGGISLKDKDDVLASVLLDLSQTASQDISQLVAKEVLNNFGRIGELHSNKVQKAGFMVLKSPDIPSILVETAFISNPQEERRLKSRAYQLKMAKAIQQGIVAYAKNHNNALVASIDEPVHKSTQGAEPVHKISKGETLLGIALKYGVTLDQLKQVNVLVSDNSIKIGQVLSIPVGS
ncbi:MAG: N-acetylmuramoyl-L-alanine amidase [Methylococcaceae bacterium]|nr:N-acetylmuramoyl-L-alanine amidase [Methylococcaceae bacterium]